MQSATHTVWTRTVVSPPLSPACLCMHLDELDGTENETKLDTQLDWITGRSVLNELNGENRKNDAKERKRLGE